MKVGIDLIHFATSDYFLDLKTFAEEKNIDPDKYYVGIGQEKMSIAPPDEDIVTLAAKACDPILNKVDSQKITAVLFATESGIDQSKAAGVFLHGLLNLPKNCRVIELKHACYAGTAAIQMARAMVIANPNEQILVIASDIARYDQGSSGEATQGCGAVAMLIKQDPRVLELEAGSGYFTDDVMDFWRPNHRTTALVDGKYSTKVYLNSLKEAWAHFSETTGRTVDDIQHFCYHIPFTKMAEKAHKTLVKVTQKQLTEAEFKQQTQPGQAYNRVLGNSYSASLYIGFCSLLDHVPEITGNRVSFFSYGSGSVAEYFSGVICEGYEQHLFTNSHQTQIQNRTELNYQEYVAFHYHSFEKLENTVFEQKNQGKYRFSAIEENIRKYESNA
jgi:hydroxymethylglutaryl-CoA synthase